MMSDVPMMPLPPAIGSDASKVDAIISGRVAASPFTSIEMLPPRFDEFDV
jgi:hypothetical protein